MKRSIAALAAAFLALVGAFGQGRTLSLTGRGSVAYKPDYAELDFSIVTKDPEYALAQTGNLEAVEEVMSTLVNTYAIKREDIASLSYRLSEDIAYEEGRQVKRGYISVTSMRVRVRELGMYKPVIISLLDAGVNGIESLSFGVHDWEALRQSALLAAYADADRKARALAEKAGLKLGRIMQLREGAVAPPMPVMQMAKASFRAEAAGDVISAGTPLVEAEVYLEYELR